MVDSYEGGGCSSGGISALMSPILVLVGSESIAFLSLMIKKRIWPGIVLAKI